MSFKITGGRATRKALRAAAPVLLEPIMKIDIMVPNENLGGVLENFNSRRGTVNELISSGDSHFIKGYAPLAEMFGYATALRSVSQGRATYSMEPSHFAKVPRQITEDILK
jgi:elongation factor G